MIINLYEFVVESKVSIEFGGLMGNRLNDILMEIRELEKSVQAELNRKEEELKYKVKKRKVIFHEETAEQHKQMTLPLFAYLMQGSILNKIVAPVTYALIVPAVFLDISLWLYQTICLTVYGIPKVRRKDHIIFDRHYLKYLNFLERLNCDYCSYFNGVASYMMEIAARTEQYWCPIKNASEKGHRHSRYHVFFDYGDAESYKTKLKELRKKYDDVE